MLKVDEIFLSIQGESTLAGLPTVFVRLYGCPLNCIYCDQPQQEENAREMSIPDIIHAIQRVTKGKAFKTICITGGEPLAQKDTINLAEVLISTFFKTVCIETNGVSKLPNNGRSWYNTYKFIMDIKCPSSGVRIKDLRQITLDNMKNLQMGDEVKCVIGGKEDFDYALSIINEANRGDLTYLFSPMFYSDNKICKTAELLPEWLLRIPDKFDARLQIQMHKIVGVK